MFKMLLISLFAVAPSSANFTLDAYDFGNGGAASNSSNFQLQASSGSVGGTASSSTYSLPAGIRASTTISTPPAPTVANPNNSYNQLKITLDANDFPSDTKYLVAISDDSFVTTKYIQLDQTIGPSASIANYQTHAAWGGGSGFWVVGLAAGTSYSAKVAALQGSATGSAFGSTATSATVEPSATFSVVTSTSAVPPFTLAFTDLAPGTVASANATITANITTNAMHGGNIVMRSQNAGLTSVLASQTIGSATADLTATSTGYGAQVTSTGQVSGGPIASSSPFSGGSHNVGQLLTTWQQLASFAAPVTDGSITLSLKAKSSTNTPSANDYGDTLTLSANLLF